MHTSESAHLQERERNKAELTAAKAKHSQRAAAIEEELVALQQVLYPPRIADIRCSALS